MTDPQETIKQSGIAPAGSTGENENESMERTISRQVEEIGVLKEKIERQRSELERLQATPQVMRLFEAEKKVREQAEEIERLKAEVLRAVQLRDALNHELLQHVVLAEAERDGALEIIRHLTGTTHALDVIRKELREKCAALAGKGEKDAV